LPEENRIEEIKQLGEKVIPDTAEHGQANIRLQINNSQHEFEALRSSIRYLKLVPFSVVKYVQIVTRQLFIRIFCAEPTLKGSRLDFSN
jgi:hypothetical protein